MHRDVARLKVKLIEGIGPVILVWISLKLDSVYVLIVS